MNYKIRTKGKNKKILKLCRKMGWGLDKDLQHSSLLSDSYILIYPLVSCINYLDSCSNHNIFNKSEAKEITLKDLKRMVREKEGEKSERADAFERQMKIVIYKGKDNDCEEVTFPIGWGVEQFHAIGHKLFKEDKEVEEQDCLYEQLNKLKEENTKLKKALKITKNKIDSVADNLAEEMDFQGINLNDI